MLIRIFRRIINRSLARREFFSNWSSSNRFVNNNARMILLFFPRPVKCFAIMRVRDEHHLDHRFSVAYASRNTSRMRMKSSRMLRALDLRHAYVSKKLGFCVCLRTQLLLFLARIAYKQRANCAFTDRRTERDFSQRSK